MLGEGVRWRAKRGSDRSTMSQLLQKPYECLTCKQQILLEKIVPLSTRSKKRWNKLKMDGVTPHICHKTAAADQQQQQQQDQQELPKPELEDIRDEIADLKAYIKTLVTEVQLMRQEVRKQQKWLRTNSVR
jgi:hypothetical protein